MAGQNLGENQDLSGSKATVLTPKPAEGIDRSRQSKTA